MCGSSSQRTSQSNTNTSISHQIGLDETENSNIVVATGNNNTLTDYNAINKSFEFGKKSLDFVSKNNKENNQLLMSHTEKALDLVGKTKEAESSKVISMVKTLSIIGGVVFIASKTLK